MIADPSFRHLQPPLTSEQLRPLGPRCRRVQFCEALTTPELRRVAAFLSEYPSVALRVYGRPDYRTLDFLVHFQSVRQVGIELYELQDISGLRHLRHDLDTLWLGRTRKRLSLRPVERFARLRELAIDGHTKDIEVVGELTTLRLLSLRSITLPDLGILRNLKALEEFELKLGGTRDLRQLACLPILRYFEAWLVRGLADLEPVAAVTSLESLFLQALKSVAALPSLHPLRKLRRVHLETMKSLLDLRPVAAAPALEELVVIDMPHLKPDAFRPFLSHPTLRAARIGLGSLRKNAAVRHLLALPDVEYRKPALEGA